MILTLVSANAEYLGTQRHINEKTEIRSYWTKPHQISTRCRQIQSASNVLYSLHYSVPTF